MSGFPQSLNDEMKRLERWSRSVKDVADRIAYEAAEARFDERLHRYNAVRVRQQTGVNELVQRGQFEAVKPLIALHDLANAQARF